MPAVSSLNLAPTLRLISLIPHLDPIVHAIDISSLRLTSSTFLEAIANQRAALAVGSRKKVSLVSMSKRR